MTDAREAAARVLREHRSVTYSDYCSCGWRGDSLWSAHVADAVLAAVEPLIESKETW